MSRWHGQHPRSVECTDQTGVLAGVGKPYLLPGLDLLIGINIWSVVKGSSCRVNDGALCYQERPGVRRTLRVVIHSELGVNVILGGSSTGKRRKDDSVRKGHPTDLERGEEGRNVMRGRHLSLEASWSKNLVIWETGSEALAS